MLKMAARASHMLGNGYASGQPSALDLDHCSGRSLVKRLVGKFLISRACCNIPGCELVVGGF
jgi:hypothetical protein